MSRAAAVRLGGLALLAGLLHVALSAYSCTVVVETSKGEGEPCTRTAECAFGLECAGGVCRRPDAGVPRDGGPDASAMDAGDADTPDADTPDADTPDADTPDADTPDADTPDADL